MKFKNGEVYDGHWKGDLMDGKGVYYFNNGDKIDGLWINGKYEESGKNVFEEDNERNSSFWEKSNIQ